MALPLTVDVNSIHTVAGPKSRVMAHFKKHGVALWFRADGKRATLFYLDGGKRRQKTWKVGRVIQRT